MFIPDEPECDLCCDVDRFPSQNGTPFISQGGIIGSALLLVYGHNMKNDTIFGTLDRFSENAFWAEVPFSPF